MSERWRRYAVPGVGFLGLFLLAAVLGYLTSGGASNGPAAGASPGNAPGTRGIVTSVGGNTLTLQTDGGQRQFSLGSDAQIERLRPATASSIATGEWINVGAMPNSQTMFTIVGLTLIPQALLQDR